MSLHRFVYYSAVVGGWAAFLAWLVLERLIEYLETLGQTAGEIRFWNVVSATVTAAVVGAAIAAGLNLVAGTSRAQWGRQLRSVLPGLAGGGIGGLVGGLCGGLLHAAMHEYLTVSVGKATIAISQVFGWTMMGLAIGGAQGIYEGSTRKTRNGLIGRTSLATKQAFELKDDTFIAQINFQALAELASKDAIYSSIPKYPAIIENYTFFNKSKCPANDILKAGKKTDSIIKDIKIIDFYEDKINLEISYQNPKKNLNDKDITPIRKKLVKNIEKLGLKLQGNI